MIRHASVMALVLSLTVTSFVDAAALPEIGTVASATMSIRQENRLGESFMRSVRSSLPLIDDPEIIAYIDAIGQRLARHAAARGRRFTFFVVDDPSVNAFAGPGGYIGIHTGLILTARSESELAAVLAHEIAHVTQRHLARAYEAINASSLPLTAAVIASIIIGSHDSQAGSAALASIAAGSAQRQINFTRSNEQEADRVGLELLAQAGYDPRAMPAFFRRLRQSTRLLDDQGLEFLRTHPVTNARIADTEGRAEQYAHRPRTESLDFLLIQARTRVLAGHDTQPATEIFHALLNEDDTPQQIAYHYGYALALLEARQAGKAAAVIAPLAKAQADNPTINLLEARIAAANGREDEAISLLKRLIEEHPGDWALTAGLTRIYLEHGRYEPARRLIRDTMTEGRAIQPLAYRLLAEAENGLGAIASSHRFLAEYYGLLGQTRAAIRQLEIALQSLRKQPDAALEKQIRARLAVYRSRLTEEERR